jgi:glutamate--cysteine ligase
MIQDAPEDTRPIQSAEDLLSVFRAAEKPPSEFRIGAEAEKFGVRADTGQPLSYDGEFSVVRLFDALKELGWQPERETPDGPVIALRRNGASITLEPGSQFELSGAALPDVHAVHRETLAHLAELAPVAAEMNLVWLGVGFHPIARQAELGWVPKQRYRIMREYLPPRGSGAHDMMRRTATVQANFDFSSEEDALRKLRTALMLAPLVNAMTANSPFVEARRAPELSHRGHVWLHMDPSRSGTIRPLLEAARPRYEDYAEWALDAGMFLFKREQRVYANSGQSFRDFLANGFEGERATLGDWKLHLNTLFPEVRLKNTLEVRMCDSLPVRFAASVPALFTGIFYDDLALARAEELARELDVEAMYSAREQLVTRGLAARIGGVPARALAERLVEIADEGLGRRARRDEQGRDERIHLAELLELVSQGRTPAEALLEPLQGDGPYPSAALIERTRMA